jgi:putative addiction module component (TIGR02574 family)
MTLRVLQKEILEVPPRSRARLAERIIESLDNFADPRLEMLWNEEIDRRVKEIKSGAEQGIPADRVMIAARCALL